MTTAQNTTATPATPCGCDHWEGRVCDAHMTPEPTPEPTGVECQGCFDMVEPADMRDTARGQRCRWCAKDAYMRSMGFGR